MQKNICLYLSACLLAISALTGCHTPRRAVARNEAAQPKFLDDVYLDGHRKTSVANNALHRKSNTNTGAGPAEAPIDRAEGNMLKKKYAALLNVKHKDISTLPLYAFIDEWMGVTYHTGGSDKDGIDCSGFAQKLYGAVYGVDLVRTSVEQFSKCSIVHSVSEASEGDLVFFHIGGKRISHVGIYLMNDYFVHASTSQGIVISSLNDEYWQKYLAGFGKVPRTVQ